MGNKPSLASQAIENSSIQPYAKTIIIPVFGWPSHRNGFIERDMETKSQYGIGGDYIFTPFVQPISDTISNTTFYTTFAAQNAASIINVQPYSFPFNEPNVITNVSKQTKQQILSLPPVSQNEVQTLSETIGIASTSSPSSTSASASTSTTSASKSILSHTFDQGKVPFLLLKLNRHIPISERLIGNEFTYVNFQHHQSYAMNIGTLHGFKPTQQRLPYTHLPRPIDFTTKNDDIPSSYMLLPPPILFRTVLQCGYSFEDLLYTQHATTVPVVHGCTIVFIDCINTWSIEMFSEFVHQTQDLQLNGCQLQLTNVNIHMILFNSDKIDIGLIDSKQIETILVQLGFKPEHIHFHAMNMTEEFVQIYSQTDVRIADPNNVNEHNSKLIKNLPPKLVIRDQIDVISKSDADIIGNLIWNDLYDKIISISTENEIKSGQWLNNNNLTMPLVIPNSQWPTSSIISQYLALKNDLGVLKLNMLVDVKNIDEIDKRFKFPFPRGDIGNSILKTLIVQYLQQRERYCSGNNNNNGSDDDDDESKYHNCTMPQYYFPPQLTHLKKRLQPIQKTYPRPIPNKFINYMKGIDPELKLSANMDPIAGEKNFIQTFEKDINDPNNNNNQIDPEFIENDEDDAYNKAYKAYGRAATGPRPRYHKDFPILQKTLPSDLNFRAYINIDQTMLFSDPNNFFHFLNLPPVEEKKRKNNNNNGILPEIQSTTEIKWNDKITPHVAVALNYIRDLLIENELRSKFGDFTTPPFPTTNPHQVTSAELKPSPSLICQFNPGYRALSPYHGFTMFTYHAPDDYKHLDEPNHNTLDGETTNFHSLPLASSKCSYHRLYINTSGGRFRKDNSEQLAREEEERPLAAEKLAKQIKYNITMQYITLPSLRSTISEQMKSLQHGAYTYEPKLQWFSPLEYLYAARIIPFYYIDSYAHSCRPFCIDDKGIDVKKSQDILNARRNGEIRCEACDSNCGTCTKCIEFKKYSEPPIPSLTQYSQLEINGLDGDIYPNVTPDMNNTINFKAKDVTFNDLYTSFSTTKVNRGNPIASVDKFYDLTQLDCPVHIIILCVNRVVCCTRELAQKDQEQATQLERVMKEKNLIDKTKNRPIPSNLWEIPRQFDIPQKGQKLTQLQPITMISETITLDQFEHFATNIPKLYKQELLSLLLPLTTFTSMDKLESLWNFHFVTAEQLPSLLRHIQSNALDIRFRLLHELMGK